MKLSHRFHLLAFLVAALALAAPTAPLLGQKRVERKLKIGETAKESVDESYIRNRLVEHVKYLASEELAGRRPGTQGNEDAADYIAAHFMRFDLEPASGTPKASRAA